MTYLAIDEWIIVLSGAHQFGLPAGRLHVAPISNIRGCRLPLAGVPTAETAGQHGVTSQRHCSRQVAGVSLFRSQPLARASQEYPTLEKQPNWNVDTTPEPPEWDALLHEVLERGKAVPEVTWRKPGEDGAREVDRSPKCMNKEQRTIRLANWNGAGRCCRFRNAHA